MVYGDVKKKPKIMGKRWNAFTFFCTMQTGWTKKAQTRIRRWLPRGCHRRNLGLWLLICLFSNKSAAIPGRAFAFCPVRSPQVIDLHWLL